MIIRRDGPRTFCSSMPYADASRQGNSRCGDIEQVDKKTKITV